MIMMYMHPFMTTSDPASLPCACTTLRKASRAMGRLYDEAMADTGMTVNQYAILRQIERGAAQPLSRLAEALVMDRTSLYRAIAPLERQGWVSIEAEGKRTKIATLTPAGHAAMTAAAPDWRKAQRDFVAAMGVEAWAAMAATLGDMVAIAQGEQA
jgi:DNA-binding MarR family transcriptional regulator